VSLFPGPTMRIPCGYGKLVSKALSKRLLAHYDGENGTAFVVKSPLFGIALSSYFIVRSGAELPSAISVGFLVGAFSYRRARRELLTWGSDSVGSRTLPRGVGQSPMARAEQHPPAESAQ
jgi:hypothetical protein